MGKFKDFINQKSLFGEIMRFLLVGGISTIVDFITMGVVLYIAAPNNYDNFINVFFGRNEDPTSFAALFGTGLGFVFGVIINYTLSVLFVFNESGDTRTIKGFLRFAVLSLAGLMLHEIGMWGLHVKLYVNEWVVKVVMTIIVTGYNFITRRFILFKESSKNSEEQKKPAEHEKTENSIEPEKSEKTEEREKSTEDKKRQEKEKTAKPD